MNFLALLQKKDVKRFLILALICLLLYNLRSMLNIFLLTFLITYLMNRFHVFVTRQVHKLVSINPKLLLILLYLILTAALVLGGMKLFPAIVSQVSQLINLLDQAYKAAQDTEFMSNLISLFNKLDLQGMTKVGLGFFMKVSNWGVTFFLALLLSLFFLLGKDNVIRFTRQFQNSKLSWLYNELEYFSRTFALTFGKVIETQLLIAFINTILTTIALWLMGFPNLIGLAVMVFILGLIPVAGVFISLIPLGAIAYSLGGIPYIVYLGITISIIHPLEAYVLNPKFMASKTHLPMFYTFIILLFSEHYFGVWGLIVGIPLFIFMLDIMEVSRLKTSDPDAISDVNPSDIQ